MNRVYCVIASALLVGCATTTMDRIMKSWQGEHIDQVVARWGYPNAEREFRGRKLYVWNDGGAYVFPSYTSTTGTVTRVGPGVAAVSSQTFGIGGGTISGQCERTLEIDSAGKVVSWQWAGNDCCVMAVSGRCAQLANPSALK